MLETLKNDLTSRSGNVTRKSHSFRTALAGLAMAVSLGGCASMTGGDRIFLQQHQATVALTQAVMAAEYDNPDAVDVLYDGEMALNQACGPLQAVAYRKSNDETVYPWHHMAAYDSLDDCNAQIEAVEDLLWRVDPETAGHYLGRSLISARVEQ
jgi:hypothetical protein